MSVCVCVFAICARVSCSVTIIAVVAEGIGGQVIAGLTAPVLRFAESYPSISAFSFADAGHFLIIVLIDFQFIRDLIRCRFIIILSCSSNMVAEGIGGKVSGAVACWRRALC